VGKQEAKLLREARLEESGRRHDATILPGLSTNIILSEVMGTFLS
jgi:hypothetical protein